MNLNGMVKNILPAMVRLTILLLEKLPVHLSVLNVMCKNPHSH